MNINLLSDKVISKDTNIIDIILKNRAIKDTFNFLHPPYPKIKLNLKPTVKLIRKNISKNILIYGDYDVDGITSTAILWQSLVKLSSKIIPFIPDRQTDGYGFKADSFIRFQTEKNITFDLLITVDNGIVAHSEFKKLLKKQQIDIIVVDHHLPSNEKLPVNCLVHSPDVCGAALSWFLAKEFDPNADIGLAALGTVADCQPLQNLNRSLVVHGLQSLNLNPSPGIKKLMSVSGLKPDSLKSYELGFVLGPRINAVGRLSNPTDALRLLCSQNSLQAAKYAATLNDYNQTRQNLQKESLDVAQKDLDLTNKIIFVSGKFNPGIIGLIAGRLTEKYSLPSIVIAVDGELAKGSCRSISAFNMIKSLRLFDPLFVDLGGHPGAAGFSIYTKNIPKLKQKITKLANTQLKKYLPESVVEVDAQILPEAVTLKNIKTLKQLEPFGIGNPEPMFLFKQVIITSKKIIGSKGDHLKLKLGNLDAIAFKKGDLDKTLNIGDKIDVVAKLDFNTWNNVTTPQLIVKEIIKT
ncbi:MAG: single-stranded-DNA-specific exonuclease RecJ [Candidatus Shapirobacteria bacterium]|nr:single-stranded-DNA-specific exonuclease RecJ [Candidatus Shapirobacteria bacterium]